MCREAHVFANEYALCLCVGLITVCTYFAGLPKAISSSCRANL